MTPSLKILAVDDDAMICNIYKMIFGDEGYDLTVRVEAVIHKPFNVSDVLCKVREVSSQEPFNPFQTSVAR